MASTTNRLRLVAERRPFRRIGPSVEVGDAVGEVGDALAEPTFARGQLGDGLQLLRLKKIQRLSFYLCSRYLQHVMDDDRLTTG